MSDTAKLPNSLQSEGLVARAIVERHTECTLKISEEFSFWTWSCGVGDTVGFTGLGLPYPFLPPLQAQSRCQTFPARLHLILVLFLAKGFLYADA